jgi:Tfp pilus assembly protein PilF
MTGVPASTPDRRDLWAVVVLVVASCLAALPTAAANDLPGADQRWIQLQTENFTFISNAGRSATKEVALDLEELRLVLSRLSDYELQSPVPTTIYVFRHRRSFAPFNLRLNGRPADLAGYFLHRPHGNYIAVNADVARASAVVFHEYVHYLTATNLGELPVWIAEGLAEFYETFRVLGNEVFIGLPNQNHMARLRGSLPIDLDELLLVDHNSPLYNEADRRTDLYAESWAVTHYLLLGSEERRGQLEEYLRLIRDGAPYGEAFETAFGGDTKALHKEVANHLRRARLPYLQTTLQLDLDAQVLLRELDRSEILFRLGDLLANQQDDRPQRLAYFEAAVEADPENGRAWSALALEAENRADWRSAERFHRRAVSAAPQDPSVLFRWGEFLAARGGRTDEAMAAHAASTQLDPSFGPAWASLTRTLVEVGADDAEALATAEHAHALQPTDLTVANDLLKMYLRADRRADATQLLASSFRTHPVHQAQGWALVAQKDLQQSREHLLGGDPKAATGRLNLANDAIRRSSASEVLRESAAAAEAAIRSFEAAVLCNSGRELLAAGDEEQAAAVLARALDLADEGPVAAACRQLRDSIERPTDLADTGGAPRIDLTVDDVNRLNTLLTARDWLGALAHLRSLRAGLEGESRQWVDAKIDEIEAVIGYNHFVEQYNLAVDLYNDDRYDEVVQILVELLPTLPEGPQKKRARELLEDSRKALRNAGQ